MTTEQGMGDAGAAAESIGRVIEQLKQVVLGQDEAIEQVAIALLAGGHVLLEGVPGLGKTLLVRAMAAALDCSFARIQFTPDLMPSDVSGHAIYDPKSETFRIRKGPVFTNLLLADEINRAPAKTQSALLEVMQENQVTIEGTSHKLAPPFLTIATQNPVEHEGTYPLPEAQLDRFLLMTTIGYPDAEAEAAMATMVTTGHRQSEFDLSDVTKVLGPEEVVAMQEQVSRVSVDPAVVAYAVEIVQSTRRWPGVRLGAGPRGSIALLRASRARAFMQGRDFVVPDDVVAIALPALRHRIALGPELIIEGRDADSILEQVIAQVEAPRR